MGARLNSLETYSDLGVISERPSAGDASNILGHYNKMG